MRYNDLVPELSVLDFDRSINFYTQLLPFKVEYSRPEKGFAFLAFGGSQIMLEQLSNTNAASELEFREGHWRTADLEYPLGRGISLSVRVEKLDEIVRLLTDANYPIKVSPREAWYRRENILVGELQLLVLDPDGYLLRFQQSLGEKSVTQQT